MLKISNDFFEQLFVKKFRKIAGGEVYIIIYLKLQILSSKTNGKIFYEGTENNLYKELALTIDEKIEDIEIALMMFEKYKLIKFSENRKEFSFTEKSEVKKFKI